MSLAYDRAKALLDFLDAGTEAARPRGETVRQVRQRLCRYCETQITIAYTPHGGWCALDRAPEGDIVIVEATVRERAEHHADAARYVFHACKLGER